MEDPTKIDSSGGSSKGNENRTAVKSSTTGDASNGDFVAGTVLASRYRIIGLVGKGGMGEVYKAEDIKLSQMVALKFLPDRYQNDSAALERFHAEVRNARQVSHVNVCRVFDIGEIDGRHFLSMEFVDGDDLSELLTRVGRFTSERAVEISRQLCVGMEAIHKAGILHRDFKPANIIIDKKGVARITDFGIAGIEAEISKDEIRSGTPAYMSPEQITGKQVTTRSDIYALGLVIYEIFTGKQAFIADNVIELIKKHQTETPTNPSEIVKGIDPLVESVIAQCLEKDPKDRPQTALQVAMALPGGNPLQIALDAGQTPSPEMVAASPKKGALRTVIAAGLLGLILLGIIATVAISKRSYINRLVPLNKPPEALAERSRELVERFGYLPGDSYSAFAKDSGYTNHLKSTDNSPDRWQKLMPGQPAAIRFWYRSSPQPLTAVENALVTLNDPPNVIGGMAVVQLDTKGRLFGFDGVPSRVDLPTAASGEFDWGLVFREAGFDLAAFQSVDPQWTPPTAFDQRRAFAGTYPEQPDIPIRVDLAAYRGKLVHFEIVEPWTPAPEEIVDRGSFVAPFIGAGIYFGILAFSCWLAFKNVRSGRSDLKGTVRVTTALFAMRMASWFFTSHYVASLSEVLVLIVGIQSALYWAVSAGLMYLAFEPFLRRRSPERIISWSRLLAGDWRDPLIGRDLLIGGAAASVIGVVWVVLTYFVPLSQGLPPSLSITAIQGPGGRLLGGSQAVPLILLDSLSVAVIGSFLVSFLILFVGMLLRRRWLGVAAVLVFVIGIQFSAAGAFENLNETLTNIIFSVLMVLTAARFGVLAMLSAMVFSETFNRPVTSELSAWYAGEFWLYALFCILLGVFGFYTSTAGQKIWQGKILGDET
ncbi:MAG: bifunctional serine/threonine protein kinase/MFS transporter [Acidobacteriota bacterium]